MVLTIINTFLLMFCYIDDQAGMSFVFLCPYNSQEQRYIERNMQELRQIYRKEVLNESEIEVIPDHVLKSNDLIRNDIISHYD